MESAVDDTGEPLPMQSFGDIGDGATPTGVVQGLGTDDITDNARTYCNGGTGVVEAGFDRENGWFACHVGVLYRYD